MKYLKKIGKNSRIAFEKLKKVDHKKIKKVLQNYNKKILENKKMIIKENSKDVKNTNTEAVTKTQNRDKGKNIFHPNLINWSYLNLGNVALTHKNINNNIPTFIKNHKKPGTKLNM